MKRLYFISGLGADERAFHLLDTGGVEGVFLPWLAPERNEPLDRYVERMGASVADPEESMVLGLSFGGIIAVEMAKRMPFRGTILVSSIKTSAEKPRYLRFMKACPAHRLAPARFFNRYNPVVARAFGIANSFENELLKSVIEATDPALAKWAVGEIAGWENSIVPHNVTHIHGSEDRLFPFKYVRNAVRIEGGTHFMIVNRAAMIGSLVREAVEKSSRVTCSAERGGTRVS